jgi:hypothetical protein
MGSTILENIGCTQNSSAAEKKIALAKAVSQSPLRVR